MELDDIVGNVMDTLKELGIDDDTLGRNTKYSGFDKFRFLIGISAFDQFFFNFDQNLDFGENFLILNNISTFLDQFLIVTNTIHF